MILSFKNSIFPSKQLFPRLSECLTRLTRTPLLVLSYGVGQLKGLVSFKLLNKSQEEEQSSSEDFNTQNSKMPQSTENESGNLFRFPSYLAHYNALVRCLETSSSISPEAIELLQTLQTDWPNVPPHEILLGEPWDIHKPIIRTNTHLSNDFDAALINITNAGRIIISESEKGYLRFLLSHWRGWSATLPQHIEDPCFKCIQWRFRYLGHLYPILDNVWWPEEVELLPAGIVASTSSYFLLASAESYYVYIMEMDALFKAGNTLQEVFIGLKEHREQPRDDCWEYEESSEYEDDYYRHFPQWHYRSDGVNELEGKVEPFIPPNDIVGMNTGNVAR